MAIYEHANQPARTLMDQLNEANEAHQKTSYRMKWLQSVIAYKYCHRADNIRRAEGQRMGSIAFEDDNVLVEQDVPALPTWDQDHLAYIAERMVRAGVDPRDYMEISFSVADHKMKSWPAQFRQQMAQARCVEPGEVVYRLMPLKT